MLRFKLGVKLMSLGARLCLSSDFNRDLFKDAINRNTTVGSHVDSGDHIRGTVSPMCEYDTQSVINVLCMELMINDDVAFGKIKTSKRIEYYKEEWSA
tara:strand:- start:44 stop:337 length:294 start_codon:yes stop_codon:yes gene_type:complete